MYVSYRMYVIHVGNNTLAVLKLSFCYKANNYKSTHHTFKNKKKRSPKKL